jgi:hypothetical protein
MMDKDLGEKERWLISWLTNTEGGKIYPSSPLPKGNTILSACLILIIDEDSKVALMSMVM